jgi:CO/xanthine dehydrogenase FAD-binding subunit
MPPTDASALAKTAAIRDRCSPPAEVFATAEYRSRLVAMTLFHAPW